MMTSLHLIVLLVLVTKTLTKEKNPVLSVFPDRTKPPGLNFPKKCWWAKELTPDMHVSGQLTERQIKYAAECGFKTVLSLFIYPDSEPRQTFGGNSLPNSEESRKIVEEIANLKFVNLLDLKDEWASVDAVKKLTTVLPTVPKPVLLHSDRGYTITFVTLLYLANQTRLDSNFEPRITSSDIYNISAAMGYNFLERISQEVISQITGEPIPENPVRPNTEPEDWMDYWPAQPVYKNWFIGGQITKYHIPVMEEVGFQSVVNLRSGITLDGKPNQEEVNLLNIKADTGTYASGGKEPRQWKSRLEETRLDPDRPNYFINPHSTVNYESENTEEFGDSVGYQELTEQLAFLKSSISYYHMPLDSNGEVGAFLAKHMSEILKIGKNGPVLVNCMSGKRAAYVAVLAAAVQYDKGLDWALRRALEMGYEVSEKKTPEIYQTYAYWLVTLKNRDEL